MKDRFIIFLFVLSITFGITSPKGYTQDKLEGKISISGAFALYPLVVTWVDEFKKLHPQVQINISAGGAGKGMMDVLSSMVDIGMVSREVYSEEMKKGASPFAVAKDAVVAVVNVNNPVIADILSKGLKRDAAIGIWITGEYKIWEQAFPNSIKAPIHVYTRSDACGAAETWAKYLGMKQEDLLGSGIYGDPGLALAVQKDRLGVGYNNIGYAYDHQTKQQIPGVKVVPIDLNDNGKIDPDESFYSTLDKIVVAIAQNKYPSPPARELYLVTKGKPQKKIVAEFLRWILTDGQKYVAESGYITLPKDKLAIEYTKI